LGIDIHIHDTYVVEAHLPLAIAILIVALLIVWGGVKLTKFILAMLG
jgi:hypothetical protein